MKSCPIWLYGEFEREEVTNILQIKLAAARVNAGLTQEAAAKKLGVNKQTIVNWEKGVTETKISQIRELSELYNIPIDNIFLPFKSN